MNTTNDGDYQTYKAEDGAFVREHFFGRDPRTRAMVEHLSDKEIWGLSRGGHDYRKMYAAYKAATEHTGQPTVILAKTIKGWTLGSHFEGRNSTHQMKKLKKDDLIGFRDRLFLDIPDEALDETLPPYYHPGKDSAEMEYMHERRLALGGYLPSRRSASTPLVLPGDPVYDVMKRGSGKQKVATTMAFVRLLKELMKDKEIGWRLVPIIPDEARTFGMDSLFPTAKIYSPHGQNYTSVDRELVLSYKEDKAGRHPARGHQRGRVDGVLDGGRLVVRHARHPDDPDLHLLLDVRLPAHRRRLLGGRRPDGARLRARRHRRPHDAERRGPAARGRPLAAARLHQPGVRVLRPGVRLRGRATSSRTRCAGCTATSRRRSSTTSRSTTSRTPSRPSPRTSTSRASCAASTATPPPPRATGPRRSCSRPGSRCSGRWRRSSCCRPTGTSRPTSGR